MNNLETANAVRTAEEELGDVRAGVIYMATCLPTGLSYIGQTINFQKRLSYHVLDTENGRNTRFCNAIRKHGFDAFVWRILVNGIPIAQLNTQEVFWIRFYNTYLGPGYNMTAGGDANPMDNPDAVEKMAESQRQNVINRTHHFVTDNPGPESNQQRMDDGTHNFLVDNPQPTHNLSVAGRLEHAAKIRAGMHKKQQKDFLDERLAAIEAGQDYFC